VALRTASTQSPPDSAALQLGAAAALYVLWLVSWLVLGSAAFGPTHHNWSQTLVAAVGALLAFVAVRRAGDPYPPFLVMIGLGLALLAMSWATYSVEEATPLQRFDDSGAPSYSDISYALFVFVWACAWGYLALRKWQRRPPSALTGVVYIVLVVGLAVILVSFYYPEYRSSIGTISGRLDAVTAGLEFVALVIGLACILIGQPAVLTWMLIATALLVASDMAYSGSDVPPAIAPIWMLGQFILASALLVFPRAEDPASLPQESYIRQRSGLSGVLILLSLGGMLLSVTIGLVPVHPVWKSFLAVDFVVVFVVAVVWLTDRFDEAVQFLESYTAKLHRQQLRAEDWREADASVRATLISTGLGRYLDSLRESGERLRDDVLFLGSERLYPPPRIRADRSEIRCFIVMPFSLEWSNDVHKALAAACKSVAVTPVRGDDVFTPTDILVDIWQSINNADFVIADITGRNANVLYELGVAHTLAKPVLIISRNAADIPIDLATRRVILYGQAEDAWQEDLGVKVTRAIKEILRLYQLNAPELPQVEQALHVVKTGS
jgi:hypothetical protein